MRNRSAWKPSKYIYQNGRFVGSRNPDEVGVGSRLIADLVAKFYDKNVEKYAKGRLLDLGCGKVPLLNLYERYVSEVVCVDWANTLHKNEFLDIECDISQPLPFGSAEFDTIILSDVFEHIPEPRLLWEEVARLLRDNGVVIVNVPFYYWLHEVPYDYYRYTEYALRRFAADVGLTVVHLDSIGGVPEIIADILSKTLIRLPFGGFLLARFIQWFTLWFVRGSIGKRFSDGTKWTFPLGYFVVAKKKT